MAQGSVTEKLYLELLDKLCDGNCKPGDRFPTMREIAKQYKVSLKSVHMTMDILEKRGLIIRGARKKGTFVGGGLAGPATQKAFNRTNNKVLVLLAETPATYINWNKDSFEALCAGLDEVDLSAECLKMPETRETLQETLKTASEGIKCIVLIPDKSTSEMLRENRDILLSAPVDLFCYNYASHPFGRLNCHIVSIDNGRDGMVAANYLIKKGYTKFSFVLGSNNQNWSKLRFEEFAFFARARKFTVRKISATTGWLDKCLKIVKKKEPHHAFVCVTDEYAENMKKAFLLHGLALGKDFKTFSFNDDVNAEKNGLTTMRPPVKKIGQLLARFISKEMVEHNEEIRLTYKLSSDIIERSSC